MKISLVPLIIQVYHLYTNRTKSNFLGFPWYELIFLKRNNSFIMGKNKNKKNSNKNNSSVHYAIESGVHFQHVTKAQLHKTKNDATDGPIQNKSVGKSAEDATNKEENGKFVAISKNKHVSNETDKDKQKCLDHSHKVDEWRTSSRRSPSSHRTDKSKNLRQKEDTSQVKESSKHQHYQSSNPGTSRYREGCNDSKRDVNRTINRSNSSGDYRNERNKTRNSNFNDEFSSRSDRAYTKDKYDKSKDTQVNKKLDNYGDYGYDSEFVSKKVPSKTLQLSNILTLQKFVDDKTFYIWLIENKNKFTCVTEIQGDLFVASEDSCLAHCVAEDMSMGSGIAVSFRKEFNNVDYLLSQRQRSGGLAILKDKNRFIYYLVTKKHSRGKPTLFTMWASLNKLKNHMVRNNAMSLAIPRIGCGLDQLEWCEVKHMIEYLFAETGIKITVYNLPKQSEIEDTSSKQKIRNCKVVSVNYSLIKIEEFTIIVYLCSEEGEETEQIKNLDKKFNILSSYNKSTKTLGSVIRYEKGNYILCGFVVKTKPIDNIDFISFQKCINELNLRNKKDRFEYVAIEEFSDPRDDLIFDKIINLMRNGLKYVEIYVCH